MKTKTIVYQIVVAATMLVLGLLLPFLTGQIPEIGNMLCPMHIPVFLTGFICGPFYGALIGFLTPLLRSFIFGMPLLYPTATAMSVELLSYGLISGLIYLFAKKKNILFTYIALISAMIIGRGVWGLFQLLQLSIAGNVFTFTTFLSGAFLNAIPGIILQLILIPLIVQILEKNHLIRRDNYAKLE